MSKQKILDDEISEEKVRCEICGREFVTIAHGHLKTHGISADEYMEQFPDAPLISEGYRKKLSEAMSGRHLTEKHKQHVSDAQLGEKNSMHSKEPWNKGKTKETDGRVKKIGEKISDNSSKAKKEFLQTEEGQKWQDDENIKETAKIRCEICGKKFEMITGFHLKTHDTILNKYKEQFPDALMISEDLRKKRREVQLGKHLTEAAKQKVREARLGTHLTEAAKQKVREARLGTHLTEAAKQKVSKARLGIHQSEETKQKNREGHLGIHPSEATKQKMSKAGLGRHTSDETKQKQRKSHLGKHPTELHKQHIRDNRADNSREKNGMYKGGPEKARARAEEKRRGFGFIPLNEKFPGADAHHLDKELVLYIPKVLHRSVPHNMFTGKGMEEINNLVCEYVYGIDTKDQCFIPKEEKIPKI